MEDTFLSAAAALDDSQLEQLIHAYWNDVWNYAYVLTRDREASEDLAQETFIRAFRSLSTFRGQSSYRTWLLRIVRHLVINHNRRSGLLRLLIQGGRIPLGGNPLSAEAEFWRVQEIDDIWRQVLQLPGKLREALLLSAKYGMSMAEIAEFLGIPEGTVKSRLNRARQRMTEWLKGEGE
ncbi:RNA polymerase sigma factor [Cohnella zeiphila]|uniref:RNA polymerase sigma factor n=1 Tax=Cohnella zeiphila TaxID=2761120 RepID=A0A7X0SNT8_9BACL|nr:RNA polymerase sigma factor [Cohnella zeiphila]MBB6733412.1 RNA polymerase sigma factor [Cohnella zeiphila]